MISLRLNQKTIKGRETRKGRLKEVTKEDGDILYKCHIILSRGHTGAVCCLQDEGHNFYLIMATPCRRLLVLELRLELIGPEPGAPV